MVTIFLAEGENHVSAALRLMLEYQPNIQMAGEARTAENTLAQVCIQTPDVILLDWNLPGMHPQRLLAALRNCSPKTLIIATSVRPEQKSIAAKFGVDKFLLKQLPPDQFIAALIAAITQET